MEVRTGMLLCSIPSHTFKLVVEAEEFTERWQRYYYLYCYTPSTMALISGSEPV